MKTVKTEKTKINDLLTLLEKKSYLRLKLFQIFAINSIDGMSFYYSMGKKGQQPVWGIFYKKLMNSYYKYVHTNAIKLPLKDIEEVINRADHLSVGPCPCRLIFDKDECEAPIYSCVKVNYFSETAMEMQEMANKMREAKGRKPHPQSKELTKAEAMELMRHAQKHNLVYSLESCISPYQNNICTCCADCCIELNLRYKFGLDVSRSGPYIPVFALDNCVGCSNCETRCPVNAINMIDEKPSVDLKTCLGCGICEDACEMNSVSLVIDPKRVPNYEEPGPLKMIMIFALTGVMYILFCRYKKSKGKSDNYKYATAKPRKSDLIQRM